MNDIRSRLYDRYVSIQPTGQISEQGLRLLFESYDYWYLPLFSHLKRDVRILELGCGQGAMLTYLKKHKFKNIEGIDISPEQVAIAQERGLPAYNVDIFDYLEHNKQSFDVIIAIDLVEHLSKEELLRLFTKVHQILNINGLFIIQTVNGEGLFSGQIIYGDLTHTTILNPGSLSQLLHLTGFANIRFREVAPAGRRPKTLMKAALWRLIKRGLNFIRSVEAGKTQTMWAENMICYCKKTDT